MNETVQVEASELLPAKREPSEIAKLPDRQTPQELRTVEVNEALLPAYQRAATLQLTDTEIEALQAPFADELIEIRPHDGLIYLPHIHISNRFNKVLKPGQWALICRRHWLEGNTMYGEYVLVVRGCYVGESVGGHPYQPNNPKVNYSDTLESTAAEALRRIAGKRLSCGSQVWEPEYARQWCEKHSTYANGKYVRRFNAQKPPPSTATAPPARQNPSTPIQTPHKSPQAKPEPKTATAEQHIKMLQEIEAGGPDFIQQSLQYFIHAGAILPNEDLSSVPLHWAPTMVSQMRELSGLIVKLGIDGDAPKPSWLIAPAERLNVVQGAPTQQDFDAKDAPWRSFVVPFGKSAGATLGALEKNKLFGFWANFKVETEYNGKPKSNAQLTKDYQFREALDQAGLHYQFTKKDE